MKVRHPGVVPMAQAVQRDFALMLRLAQLASLLPAVRQLCLQETLALFVAPFQDHVSLLQANRSCLASTVSSTASSNVNDNPLSLARPSGFCYSMHTCHNVCLAVFVIETL